METRVTAVRLGILSCNQKIEQQNNRLLTTMLTYVQGAMRLHTTLRTSAIAPNLPK